MSNVSAYTMRPEHPGWADFKRTLAGPDGLNFHQDENGGLVWTCRHDEALPLARQILWDTDKIDVDESIDYFHAHGACCDCEIIWNVGQGLDLPTHLWEATAAP